MSPWAERCRRAAGAQPHPRGEVAIAVLRTTFVEALVARVIRAASLERLFAVGERQPTGPTGVRGHPALGVERNKGTGSAARVAEEELARAGDCA